MGRSIVQRDQLQHHHSDLRLFDSVGDYRGDERESLANGKSSRSNWTDSMRKFRLRRFVNVNVRPASI